jgi:hypothetical protein
MQKRETGDLLFTPLNTMLFKYETFREKENITYTFYISHFTVLTGFTKQISAILLCCEIKEDIWQSVVK